MTLSKLTIISSISHFFHFLIVFSFLPILSSLDVHNSSVFIFLLIFFETYACSESTLASPRQLLNIFWKLVIRKRFYKSIWKENNFQLQWIWTWNLAFWVIQTYHIQIYLNAKFKIFKLGFVTSLLVIHTIYFLKIII